MEIYKKFSFDSAHYLPNLPSDHKCRRMHGHTFYVTLFVKGNVDPKIGWIKDFYENTPAVFTIQRNITLNNAINFEESSIYSTDVQNVYKEKTHNRIISFIIHSFFIKRSNKNTMWMC